MRPKERALSRSFRDLRVWREAHAFVLAIYRETADFPKQELYGLTSQFRRAAVSIPANIAEGFSRRSRREKARFLNIAEASLEECRYYLILTQDLGYRNDAPDLEQLAANISYLLKAYTAALLHPPDPAQ